MKLVKIKLVNWHIFTNHTINLSGNVLITGENASGKSTLLDAIYYVLSAGDDKHFNKAANQSGQRTLESYIRAKIGVEGNTYLRKEKDVISYIMLEFESDSYPLTLGCALEIVNGSNKVDSHFFVLTNRGIIDEDIINNANILPFNQFKIALKEDYLTDLSNYTIKERKRMIANDIFKLRDNNRYYDLLQNAISFKPIDMVSTFVNNFLLKEDNLNLEELKKEIKTYQELVKLIDREEEKLNYLETFYDKGNNYLKNLEMIDYLDVLNIDILKQEAKNNIETLDKLRKRLEIELDEHKSKKEENEKLIEDDHEKLNLLKNKEEYKVLKSLINEKENLEKEIEKNDEKLFIYKNILKEETKIAKTIALNYDFTKYPKNLKYSDLIIKLGEYENRLEDNKTNIITKIYELNKRKEEIKNKLEEDRNDLFKLKNGLNDYPLAVEYLIKKLKEELELKYKKEIIIKPLCEYLEIKDESWQNAIEGYLNNQKFNLLIPISYYDDASIIYDKIKNKEIYGVGIVNINKISYKEANPYSLVSKLEDINNVDAKKYVNYLLNEVMAIDDVKELKNHKIAVSKSGMVYKNYTLRALNPKSYEKPYIGQKGRIKRIKLLEKEIKLLENELKELNDKIDDLNNVLKLLNGSRIKEIKNEKDYATILNDLKFKLTDIVLEIDKYDNDLNLLSITSKINNLNDDIIYLKEQNNTLYKIIESIEKQIRDNLYDVNKLKTEEERLKEEFKNKLEKIDEFKYIDYKNKYKTTKEITDLLLKAKNYNNKNYNYLIERMRKYSESFSRDLGYDIYDLEKYLIEYNEIKNRSLQDYKENAIRAYEKSEESFKEDFLVKLREKIDEAKKSIKDLNNSLNKHKFGSDDEIYEISITSSNDDEFRRYYNIITSGKLMETKDLFSTILDKAELSVLEDLFKKISRDALSSEQEKELARYLDYRNYMAYDIKIKNKNDEIMYFSKISKEKSGGETQTPFYIIIAACFEELKAKQNSTSIVIFDEAFNNMDESRIKSLMEFYKELEIQLIIIVPTIRMYSIQPYVDDTIGIVKEGNYPIIFPFEVK